MSESIQTIDDVSEYADLTRLASHLHREVLLQVNGAVDIEHVDDNSAVLVAFMKVNSIPNALLSVFADAGVGLMPDGQDNDGFDRYVLTGATATIPENHRS